tara:strand:+ start:7403 stop:7555 length:153 start_codon:yes stop_codon:yes gene_type:complete
MKRYLSGKLLRVIWHRNTVLIKNSNYLVAVVIEGPVVGALSVQAKHIIKN